MKQTQMDVFAFSIRTMNLKNVEVEKRGSLSEINVYSPINHLFTNGMSGGI